MAECGARLNNRIHHAGICVTDLDRAVRWYADIFGFVETKRFRKEAFEIDGAVLELEGMTLEILAPFSPDGVPDPAPSLVAQLRKPGVNHIAISVSDLAGCYGKLAASGATMISPVIEGRFFFCTDPDGTVWEVKQF